MERFVADDVIAMQDGQRVGVVIGYAAGSLVYEDAKGIRRVAASDSAFKLYADPNVKREHRLSFQPLDKSAVPIRQGKPQQYGPLRQLLSEFVASEHEAAEVTEALRAFSIENGISDKDEGRESHALKVMRNAAHTHNSTTAKTMKPRISVRASAGRIYLIKE